MSITVKIDQSVLDLMNKQADYMLANFTRLETKLAAVTAERDALKIEREYLRRIEAIVNAWSKFRTTIPKAFDAIYGVLKERDALAARKEDEPDMAVPFGRGLTRAIAQFDTDHAALARDYANDDVQDGEFNLAIPHIIDAIGHIIDTLRNMQKDGAE